MKKSLLLVLILMLAAFNFIACDDGDDDDDDTTDGDTTDDDDDDDDNTTDDDDDDDDATDDDDDSAPAEGAIGSACADKTACTSDFCLNVATLNGLGMETPEDMDITNGYCSSMGCTPGENDESCPAAENGLCFSLYPFNESFASMGLCLTACSSDADCRVDEGYSCYGAADIEGLSADVIAEYYGDATVCLNQDIIDWAAASLAEAAE